VIGGLIASYVNITLLPEIVVNEFTTVSRQADFLDKILPNILPFGYVFFLYYLLVKKKTSPVILIISTFVLSIILSFLGIL